MLHRAVLTALTLMLIASCNAGGSRNTLQQEASFQPPQELLASMPDFPAADEAVHPMRATASVDASLNGADFDSASTAVSPSGNGALIPAIEGKFEWAIYRFSGVPDELISAMSCSVSGLDNGEQVYIAVADYDNSRWNFLSPQSTAQQSFPLSPERGRWQSASASTYIAVLAHDNTTFVVESVSLRYEERYSVSGTVVDGEGEPVEGVLVTSFFGGLSAVSDAGGQFTLSGLPEGNWPLAATKNGWTFYDQPLFAHIETEDISVSFVGNPGGSNFTNREAVAGNDLESGADFDFAAATLADSISALDDPQDFYRWEITEPGEYYFYFHDPLGTALFPQITVRSGPDLSPAELSTSAAVIAGSFAAGFYISEVPQTVVVEVSCSAGGADYELSLEEGPVHGMGGSVLTEQGETRLVVEAEHLDLGHETEYFCSTNGPLSYFDHHRVPGNSLVIPECFGATFSPLQQEIDLGASNYNINFTAQPLVLGDDFEPNNALLEPHVFSELPVELETAVTVGGPDNSDFYSFTPEAGQALSIAVVPEAETARDSGISVLLYNSQLQIVASLPIGHGGFFLIPKFLTNGESYTLEVRSMADGVIKCAYLLEIEAEEPAALNMLLSVGGREDVAGALFIVHNEDFEQSVEVTTGDDGITAPLYFPLDSIVNVECRRYGLSVDRETRRVTLDAPETTLNYECLDWGFDDNEPNDDEPVERLLDLPSDLSGSMSEHSDREENFRIPLPPDGAIRVELNIEGANGVMDVEGVSPDRGEVADADLSDGMSMLIPVRSEDFIDLNLNCDAGEFSYTLSISHTEGYIISGVVKNSEGDALTGANVLVTPGNQQVTVRPDGTYDFDILPPGNYSVSLLAVGGDPAYSVEEVVLSDADVDLDFSGIAEQSADDYEPNNTLFEAEEISLATPYVASIGDLFAVDLQDWFLLKDLEAGQRVEFAVEGEAQSRFRGKVYSPDLILLAELHCLSPGHSKLIFVAPAAGDYALELEGYGNYSFAGNLLP